MKKLLFLVLTIALVASCSQVPAGYVGIKVYKFGGEKGVDQEVLGTGRYWIGMNENLYLFPLFKQTYPFTKSATEGSREDESFTFQTAEGLSVNCDIGVTVHVEKDKAASIFQSYRKGIDEIIHEFLRNEIRSAFNEVGSTYKVESVYGKEKAILLQAIEKKVKDKMAPQGIIVESLYLLGEFRLPKEVIDSLNAKIQSIQNAEKSEYELRQAEAEAKKNIAEAKGQAESNRVKQASITPALIQWEAVKKWDGKLSYVSGAGAVPFINIK